MYEKNCILSVVIASIVLLSAAVSFMIKSGYVAAFDNDYMENMNIEALDDVVVIMDYSTVFENE